MQRHARTAAALAFAVGLACRVQAEMPQPWAADRPLPESPPLPPACACASLNATSSAAPPSRCGADGAVRLAAQFCAGGPDYLASLLLTGNVSWRQWAADSLVAWRPRPAAVAAVTRLGVALESANRRWRDDHLLDATADLAYCGGHAIACDVLERLGQPRRTLAPCARAGTQGDGPASVATDLPLTLPEHGSWTYFMVARPSRCIVPSE